ncbi:hypothetical protein OSCI_4060003 [Kamptonema sp. PCC 6506]|nr:hypothetical protein OSCI_4060003 [Kamptonema sp. PCC 6506]
MKLVPMLTNTQLFFLNLKADSLYVALVYPQGREIAAEVGCSIASMPRETLQESRFAPRSTR